MRKLGSYGPSLVVLATVVVVLVAGPTAVRQLTYHQTRARIELAAGGLADNPVLEELNRAYRDLATLVEPSVVHISTERVVGEAGDARVVPSSGSGWVYDDRGHVVTNYHVVQDAQRIEVQMHSGDILAAEKVGHDQFTDVAVLRVSSSRLHPAQRAEPGHKVRQGDLVFAFGSPFDFRFSMSSGVVSGIGRYVGVIRDEMGRWGYENFIQVDAAINPGNSGGPLTDIRGRVIGMNTAIATGGRRGALEEGQFAGIGLAIPIEMIEPTVEQLIETRVVQKGFLGVEVREVPRELSRRDLEALHAAGFAGQGVQVTFIAPSGPAFDAGILPGDVIVRVNGDPVNTFRQLGSMISSTPPGETVRLELWRADSGSGQGNPISLEVPLARLDTRSVFGLLPPDHERDRLEIFGIARMASCSLELANRYGVEHVPGVLVEEIVAGSQLDGRIPPGSILVTVFDVPVRSTDDLFELLERINLRPTRRVLVSFVLPGGSRVDLYLRMP
jgi:serine protease Do